MNGQIKYYVIGGQYQYRCYGGARSLLAAKRMASKCAEYWDNWQGWHVPAIYRAEDTRVVHNFYGDTRVPLPGAVPVATRGYSECWTEGR